MKNAPYKYQTVLLDQIEQYIQQDNLPVVLAASCGSGKTFMSIYYAEGYLKQNPTAKVLVLAHGQTILRSQYHDNLKVQGPDFTYKEITKGTALLKFYNKKQVFVTLPQTLQKIQVPHFDLVIVDEAHQRYFAHQVEDIIKQAKPAHQLLLTGSPSPFIARNSSTKKEFNILTLPMSELLKEGAITDVLVELASTTYPISGEDYNDIGNLKEDFKFEDLDTTTTLDKLLDKIHKRLKSVIKNNPTLYSALPTLSNWFSVLNSLEKTMFACHSQEQARQVAAYFKSKDINVALSTSDDDLEAEEVDRFINDKKCAVLIVVGRGVLGFNFEQLVNVVDMTGSQNLDRIFQLMARVVRKHPKGYEKLFFKIVPKTMASYFEHLMTGVLCLTCEEWYTKYNGHNFLQLPLPIRKNNKVNGLRTGKNNKGPKQKPKPVEYVGLPAIQLFTDITHKDNSQFNSYEWTTLGKVREKLLGIGFKIKDHSTNYKSILDFYHTHWVNMITGEIGIYSAPQTEPETDKQFYFPGSESSDPIEKRLGAIFDFYKKELHKEEFKNWQSKITLCALAKANKLCDYIDNHGYFPQKSEDKILFSFCQGVKHGQVSYIPEDQKRKIISSITREKYIKQQNWEKILELESLGQRPPLNSMLGKFFIRITNEGRNGFVKEWADFLRSKRPDWFGKGATRSFSIRTNTDHHLTFREKEKYWIFQIKIGNKHHSKMFKNKEEAIAYRDKFMKDNGLL